MEELLILYLIAVNAAAFALMHADKQRAIKKQWRIPEATLMGVAAIGGSLGALAGMYTFRPKTRHLKFTIGVPVLLMVHIYLLSQLLRPAR